MIYYILLEPCTGAAELQRTSHNIPEQYETYADAKEEAEALKAAGGCNDFEILGYCYCNLPIDEKAVKPVTNQVATGAPTSTSLDGCPFHYCDSNPACAGKCRYNN